jgi:adenylate kinase
MEIEPRLWAVVLIGPPGAGKDTQAALLSNELGLVQIKTSQVIEEKFALAPADDPVIQEQKNVKASGGLVDPKLVTAWFVERLGKVHAEGKGIITSGSPRTLPEAQEEIPLLRSLYGPDALKIIFIKVSKEESVKRNSSRRVCEKNSHPIPNFPEYQGLAACPQDGSAIITRQDDTPETTAHRYEVYTELTEPIIDFFEEKGYNIITINGEASIEDVHRDILDKLW